MAKRTFDRIPQWDKKNLNFPIRELIGEPKLREKRWRLPERLDQGAEGACVGFGWAHELLAKPTRVTGVDPRAIYARAQQIDEWPGESYSGTSVLAGAKAVTELGFLKEYRWAFDVNDVLATLVVHGPVVIGVNWHQGMVNTNSDGFIQPTGPVKGGHCVCLRGILRRNRRWNILGTNSWSDKWGVRGSFKITPDDFEILLAAGADVCVPVVR